jgi:hypothetical protein
MAFTLPIFTKPRDADQHGMENFWIKIHPNWPRNVGYKFIYAFS